MMSIDNACNCLLVPLTFSVLKMEDHLFESTIQLATQELIQMFMPMSEDNENNAKASETANEKE